MRTITASEARQEFADVIEAARREPVIIQRQKRDVVVCPWTSMNAWSI